jgi:hypothetical protein
MWGAVEGPQLEGYSTISYLAAVTQKIKVGLMVTCNSFRHPGILVKIVTTLDVLSRTTVFFVTHIGEDAEAASCVGLIDNGTVVMQGKPDELKKRSGIENAVSIETSIKNRTFSY